MWRYSSVALLLPALLMLCCDGVDAKPLFGLISTFGTTNGTSLLETLLQNHVQQKINALNALANVITFNGTFTG